MRTMDVLVVVRLPVSDTERLTRNSPRLLSGAAHVPAAMVRFPSLIICPVPFTVLVVNVIAAADAILLVPLSVRVRDVPVSVLPLPIVRLRTDAFVSSVTVYDPPTSIATESVEVGSVPPLQFPGVLQLPPKVLVQLFSGAGAADEATKKSVSRAPASA